MIRVAAVLIVFFTSLPAMIALQWALARLRPAWWAVTSVAYYRFLCWLLRIRVHIANAPTSVRPVLLVANHMSWADIVVLGATAPMVFIAKSEVAGWPLIGAAARVMKVVFVDRQRRHKTSDTINEVARRLAEGHLVVLFAEGTSSDGNRVLPFRTALIGAVEAACHHVGIDELTLQPLSVTYTGMAGMPMTRTQRPRVAWYGDMDFMPHLKEFIRRNDIDVAVNFGAPVTVHRDDDRKAVARGLETRVRSMTVSALRGRPVP